MRDKNLFPDKIMLNGMSFYGYHGVNQEESEIGGQFVVDLEIYLDLAQSGLSDLLVDTVNYSELYRIVRSVVEEERYNLIEAVAEAICKRVLYTFHVMAICVKVSKIKPPIRGAVLREAAVEIYREQKS